IEVKRACAKRIVETARQAACVLAIARVARDHVARWRPGRPFSLAANRCVSAQREPFLADADAVANRLATALHVIEAASRGIDDNRSRLVVGPVFHLPTAKLRL